MTTYTRAPVGAPSALPCIVDARASREYIGQRSTQLDESGWQEARWVLQVVGTHREEVRLTAWRARYLPLERKEIMEILFAPPLSGERGTAFGAFQGCSFNWLHCSTPSPSSFGLS